jgi:hypothetical protein
MAEGLFNYTPTNNVRVSTQPVMVNQKADLGAAKAFQSISNLVKAGTSAYNKYEEAKDKTSLLEASNEANEVHKWYSQEINKTTDPYKQNEVLQQYTTALDSIEQGYELEDKYKNTFVNSNKAFRGEQERLIGKRVLAQQIADTDQGLGNLAASLAGADSKEIATVMKDASTAYTNLGLSKEQASDKIFATVVDKKIEAFNIDPLYSDLSQLEKEIESFVQSFDPKLKNKENDTNYKKLLSDLKKEQKGLAKAHLESYLSSEAIGQKDFDAEADSLAHAFSPLELSNMKEAKANKVYALKITRDARADAEQNNKTEMLRRNNKALLADPEATEQEIKDSIERMYNAGEYTDIEAASKFNQWKAAKESGTTSSVSAAAKKEAKAKKEEATRVARLELDKKSTKDGMSPQMLEGYLALKNGGVISKDDQKAYDRYKVQWGIENSATDLLTLIGKTSNSYVGTEAEAGSKAVLNNAVTNMYSNDGFSATGILQIYKNHDLKGEVVNFIKKDLGNSQTAVQAISKVQAMKVINDPAVQTMLGDKLYYQLAALESRMTTDKEGNPVISPNDLRDIEQIIANPGQVKVDRAPFTEALKENPNIYKYGAEYDIALKLGADVDDVIENIQAKIKQEFPAPGVVLTGYKGVNLTEDDMNILQNVSTEVNKMMPQFNGIAYNPADGRFYYSSATDKFADLISRTTQDGNIEPVTELNGVNGVINVLENNVIDSYREKYGENMYKQLEIIGNPTTFIIDKAKQLSDSLLSFNPKSEPMTFEESPLGSLWERFKDGFSGLQGAELTPVTFDMTYDNEIGKESKKPHHPSDSSGVTIGAGYDMKNRSATEIKNDMIEIGVDKGTAEVLSAASGLSGDKAKLFTQLFDSIELTDTQQRQLFDKVLPTYVKKAKTGYNTISKNISKAPKYDELPNTVKELLVDYSYNTGVTKFPKFFKALIKGDKETALKEYTRYTGKTKLGRRNDDTLKILNKYDFKDLTE